MITKVSNCRPLNLTDNFFDDQPEDSGLKVCASLVKCMGGSLSIQKLQPKSDLDETIEVTFSIQISKVQ